MNTNIYVSRLHGVAPRVRSLLTTISVEVSLFFFNHSSVDVQVRVSSLQLPPLRHILWYFSFRRELFGKIKTTVLQREAPLTAPEETPSAARPGSSCGSSFVVVALRHLRGFWFSRKLGGDQGQAGALADGGPGVDGLGTVGRQHSAVLPHAARDGQTGLVPHGFCERQLRRNRDTRLGSKQTEMRKRCRSEFLQTASLWRSA